MRFPLTIRSCEIRLWRVAVIFICVGCVGVASLVALSKHSEPRSWALRHGMTPAEVRTIMKEPDVVLGEGDDFKWEYSHVERIELYFRDGHLSYAAGKGHPVNNWQAAH